MPAYLLDEHWTLRFFNSACEKLLGAALSKLQSIQLAALGPGDLSSEVMSLAHAMLPPVDLRNNETGQFRFSAVSLEGPQNEDPSKRREVFLEYVARWTCFSADDSRCRLVTLHRDLPEVTDSSLSRRLQDDWLRTRRSYADLPPPCQLLGSSIYAETLREQVRVAQQFSGAVEIVAAPGSGEEAIARYVHQGRPASLQGPLIALECTLLDAELLQTTLRELVRASQEAGLGTGCLLLLNIHRLAESGQLELLNLLSFPQVLFTTIVTTNRPMLELANEGQFSEDLARKLSIMSLAVLPMEQRNHDLLEIAHALLQNHNERRKEPLAGFSEETLQRFVQSSWRHDFEQFERVIELAVLRAAGPWVEIADLPQSLCRAPVVADHAVWKLEPMVLERFLSEVELLLIQKALDQCHGNKTKAAQLLGMTRGTFHRKVVQLDAGERAGEEHGT